MITPSSSVIFCSALVLASSVSCTSMVKFPFLMIFRFGFVGSKFENGVGGNVPPPRPAKDAIFIARFCLGMCSIAMSLDDISISWYGCGVSSPKNQNPIARTAMIGIMFS